MRLNPITFTLSLASLAVFVGCGTTAADDPLSGSWKNTECFGSASKPADIESCSTEIKFTDALKVELTAVAVSLAATAITPGCTTTRSVTGQEWSTDHPSGTFTVTGTGTSTMKRTMCVTPADNKDSSPATDIAIPSGDTKYTLAGEVLTITTGSLKGVYKR